MGVPVTVAPLPVTRLRAAHEVFITSTAGGIMPVTRIDGAPDRALLGKAHEPGLDHPARIGRPSAHPSLCDAQGRVHAGLHGREDVAVEQPAARVVG